MSPDVIKSKMQIAEEIIHKLEEFIRSEQAFSQDYYISATEPLLQLEDLLDYCRLHLPHRLDLIERTEQERNRLFEWARIANKTNDAEAKGKTKGFAIRLVKKLQQILELLRDELAALKPAKTRQENKDTKRKREGEIEPKPPEILQKILWIRKYGREYWKLVLLAILVLLIYCIWTLLK